MPVTNGKIKVLCVFGTRPEAIKMAPVVKELLKYPDHAAIAIHLYHPAGLDDSDLAHDESSLQMPFGPYEKLLLA